MVLATCWTGEVYQASCAEWHTYTSRENRGGKGHCNRDQINIGRYQWWIWQKLCSMNILTDVGISLPSYQTGKVAFPHVTKLMMMYIVISSMARYGCSLMKPYAKHRGIPSAAWSNVLYILLASPRWSWYGRSFAEVIRGTPRVFLVLSTIERLVSCACALQFL